MISSIILTLTLEVFGGGHFIAYKELPPPPNFKTNACRNWNLSADASKERRAIWKLNLWKK